MTSQHDSLPPHAPAAPSGKVLVATSLAALGVVFGDIGTSPLYALRECFMAHTRLEPTPANVTGAVSLIFWALTLTVSLKYVSYVLRADNGGEGGELALTALAQRCVGDSRRKRNFVLTLGVFGAALLYGDGAITPAISVLSAVEGLTTVAPQAEQIVVPLAVAILVALFAVQRTGTAGIARVFGPIMLLWFVVLAALGVSQLVRAPEILFALSPTPAVAFFAEHGVPGAVILSCVFLAVTGGEALYADMGHFGARPIRLAWLGLVAPCLVLNYLGQGALLLRDPSAAEQPFFQMAPRWAVLPLVLLSTTATVIASQALISGAYSVTRQATMLGLLPRVRVLHTSAQHIGQIYVPFVNWALLLATVGLVLGFGSSSALANAYGTAVMLTMLITTLLAHVVARSAWRWGPLRAGSVTVCLLVIDLAFLVANVGKVFAGGWIPLVAAVLISSLMGIWYVGRRQLGANLKRRMLPLEDFFELMRIELPSRVPGTAVFLAGNAQGTPPALLQNFEHNRVVHQRVLLLSVEFCNVPFVRHRDRVEVTPLQDGFTRILARFGFMESPDVPEVLADPRIGEQRPSMEYTTFFLGRESLSITKSRGLPRWAKRVFAFIAANNERPADFFNLPTERVVELGGRIEL